MDKAEFMKVMQIPEEWEIFGMYPKDLFDFQMIYFEPEHIEVAEHDRQCMFHWWLKREPSEEELRKLVELSFLEPDQRMAEYARSYIRLAENYTPQIEDSLDLEV